jgi:hypothetical protein
VWPVLQAVKTQQLCLKLDLVQHACAATRSSALPQAMTVLLHSNNYLYVNCPAAAAEALLLALHG